MNFCEMMRNLYWKELDLENNVPVALLFNFMSPSHWFEPKSCLEVTYIRANVESNGILIQALFARLDSDGRQERRIAFIKFEFKVANRPKLHSDCSR